MHIHSYNCFIDKRIFVLVFISSCVGSDEKCAMVADCIRYFFFGGPIVIFISGARRGFSVITISEEGISRCLFGKFCKLTMKWDEIYEISYFESGMAFLIFSQTKSIQGLSYWKITKIKNLIQIQLTQKNYDAVKQYIQQPIKGLTDAKMKQLKLK